MYTVCRICTVIAFAYSTALNLTGLVGFLLLKVVVAIPIKISIFSIIGGKFYIPTKYRLIELTMQRDYPPKIDFFEIV
jgi:hypothetical protein